MQTIETVLRAGAYGTGHKIFNILSKPNVIVLLEFIEQNPNCCSKDIFDAGINKSRANISHMLKELNELQIVIVNPCPGVRNKIKLNHPRIEDINNSIARLL